MAEFTQYEMGGQVYEFPAEMSQEEVAGILQGRWEDSNSSGEANLNPSPDFDDFNTHLSKDTIDRLIHIESGGRADAKAKTSSATGLGQFINSTWLGTIRKNRPDLVEGKTEAEVLAMRTDPLLSIEMTTRLMEENHDYLSKRGVEVTDGSLYMAHFAGMGTARKVYTADRNAPASEAFSPAQIRANRSILAGKTVGEVIDWAERKMSRAKTGYVDQFMSGGGFGEAAQQQHTQAAAPGTVEAPITASSEQPAAQENLFSSLDFSDRLGGLDSGIYRDGKGNLIEIRNGFVVSVNGRSV